MRLNEKTAVARQMAPQEYFHYEKLMRWRAFISDTAAEFGFTQTRWHTFKRLDTIAAKHEKLPTSGDDFMGYQFGIGMSARSSLNHKVYRNTDKIESYMDMVENGRSPVSDMIALTPDDLRTQFIARTLGDGHGLSIDEYEHVFKNSLSHDFGDVVERLLSAELISLQHNNLKMTETGRLLYDLITLSFYPNNAKQWLLEKLGDYQLGNTSVSVKVS